MDEWTTGARNGTRTETDASRLSDELEQATDEYAVACNLTAEREAAFLRAYHGAIVESDSSLSNAARERFAESAAVEQKIALRFAEANEKAAKAKVEELKHRLMAALSHQRMIREQT